MNDFNELRPGIIALTVCSTGMPANQWLSTMTARLVSPSETHCSFQWPKNWMAGVSMAGKPSLVSSLMLPVSCHDDAGQSCLRFLAEFK